ncbi:MAG TPA: hypothetical protein RMH99_02470 [Sandaracinaceae bacterium LLY-WYZ-13_1]|nr:hypothetical protein [Sandaracinaceae bacterium LLY-WYZ-13_1]
MIRTALRIAALVGVLAGVWAVRVVTASHGELRDAERLQAREDLDGAILAYRRAARLYAPGNPYATLALDRLATLAREAEADDQPERALAAWRAVRGAILSTRSVYVPHRARLERAEDAIARLSARGAPAAEREAAERRARAQLDDPDRPVLGWTWMALTGWLVWTGAAFAFAQRALDEEGRVRGDAARWWGTVVVVGFGVFVLGMALA